MSDTQVPSKEEVIRWLHRINKQGGLGFDAHAALDNALLYLRGEPAKPSKEQNTEALAWALQAHEDLAKMLAEGGGNMLHVRANRALGILFAEIERLEKILYPIGAAHEPLPRYSCIEKGCPGEHVSKFDICAASPESAPEPEASNDCGVREAFKTIEHYMQPGSAMVGAVRYLKLEIRKLEKMVIEESARASQPPAANEVRQVAYLIENNGGITRALRYRCMSSGGLGWTYDVNAALWFCRRIDADEFAAEDPEDVRIREHVFVTYSTATKGDSHG